MVRLIGREIRYLAIKRVLTLPLAKPRQKGAEVLKMNELFIYRYICYFTDSIKMCRK
jgi:hypothetical protein